MEDEYESWGVTHTVPLDDDAADEASVADEAARESKDSGLNRHMVENVYQGNERMPA